MSKTGYWIAIGCPVCSRTSVAKTSKTVTSLSGVAKRTRFLRKPSGKLYLFYRFTSSAPTHTEVSKHNSLYAAFKLAKTVRHIRYSPSPKIWQARFTGISPLRVTAKASNSRMKCLLRPSHGGVTRYTLPSSPWRERC